MKEDCPVDPIIWHDGFLKTMAAAEEPLALASFAYGLAAFEGILCLEDLDRPRHTNLFRLEDHLDRLGESLGVLGWEPPCSRGEMARAVRDLAGRLGPGSRYLRPIVYSGHRFFDLRVKQRAHELHLLIQSTAVPLPLFTLQMARPLRLTISREIGALWPPRICQAKLSGKYLLHLLSREEARGRGYDQAILLDRDGRIAEASTANLFWVMGRRLFTPPARYALAGITRASVLTLAREVGLTVEERAITAAELIQADEIFLTSSAQGLSSVSEIDECWRAASYEVAAELRQRYLSVLRGERKEHASWLTPVCC